MSVFFLNFPQFYPLNITNCPKTQTNMKILVFTKVTTPIADQNSNFLGHFGTIK